MIGDASLFVDFVKKERAFVTYEDKSKGEILGKSVVGNPFIITIDGVFFVKRA